MESRPRYFVALFVFCFVGAANGDFLGGLFFFCRYVASGDTSMRGEIGSEGNENPEAR